MPEKFLLFAIGTEQSDGFSGGPTFLGHACLLYLYLTTSISNLPHKVVPRGLDKGVELFSVKGGNLR